MSTQQTAQTAGTAISAVGTATGNPYIAAAGKIIGIASSFFGGDKDYPYGRADVYYKNGKAYVNGVTTLDGANESDYRALGKTVADNINYFVEAVGATPSFNDKPNSVFKLGSASGRNSRIGTGFFAGGRGDFATGATYTNLKTADQAINLSLTEFLSKVDFKDKPEIDALIDENLKAGKTASDIFGIVYNSLQAPVNNEPVEGGYDPNIVTSQPENFGSQAALVNPKGNSAIALLMAAGLWFIMK